MLPPLPIMDKDEEEQVQIYGFSYWSELPLELKIDILCRLPDKLLITLKCVSKSWYFLISNHCAPKISCRVLCGAIYTMEVEASSVRYLSFSWDSDYFEFHDPQEQLMWGATNVFLHMFPFKYKADDFQDCCNGLILLARFVSSPVPTQYYVCNPITYEYIAIPINPNHVNEECSCVASLVFDPISPPFSFMIVVRKEYSHNSLYLDIVSSVSNSWSAHIAPLDYIIDGFKFINRAIYLKGVLYMISLAKYLVSISVTVDSEMIESRATALPRKDEMVSCGAFGASKMNLVYSESDESEMLIWQLQKGGGWILQHRIRIDEYLTHIKPNLYNWLRNQPDCGQMKVYAFDPNSEDIIIANSLLLHKYNPITNVTLDYEHRPPSRKIVGGQHRIFLLSRCPVILNSVVRY